MQIDEHGIIINFLCYDFIIQNNTNMKYFVSLEVGEWGVFIMILKMQPACRTGIKKSLSQFIFCFLI